MSGFTGSQHAILIIPAVAIISVTGWSFISQFIFSEKPKKVKLYYFDGRGVAEISRILMKIGKLDFEDVRFNIKVKPEGG
jgi:hypothetical protein